jgi:hypothetical protein
MNRNFRTAYLNSLGLQEVSIKNSLEIILIENVVDIEKLRKFCLRFEIPTKYKGIVWKLLLGVIPPYREAWDFVQQQREGQYQDLKRMATLFASRTVHNIKNSDESGQIYYIRRNFRDRENDEDEDPTEMLTLARVFTRICNTECDAYFCFDKFLLATVEKFGRKSKSICKQLNLLDSLMRSQDPEFLRYFDQAGVKLEQIAYTYISENE